MKLTRVGLSLLIVLLLMTGVVAAGNWSFTDKGYRVWNNHALPDETSTWSGGMDAGGYASEMDGGS